MVAGARSKGERGGERLAAARAERFGNTTNLIPATAADQGAAPGVQGQAAGPAGRGKDQVEKASQKLLHRSGDGSRIEPPERLVA
jgi:hypothetical protein